MGRIEKNPRFMAKESNRQEFSMGGLGEPYERQLCVLYVDDNPGDFLLVRDYLREAGFSKPPEVHRAVSLQEARELLTSPGGPNVFDIILLDLSLPDSAGQDTLSQIKELAPELPVMILSGNEDWDLAYNLVVSGAQDFLPKDELNAALLSRSILYAIQRNRARLDLAAVNTQLSNTSRDLREAHMLLNQAEKLDSLGRLAAGVAHEVKNPLATLQLGIDFLSRKPALMDDASQLILEQMQEAINRADAIIRGMVDYSRSDELNKVTQDINEIVRRALRMVQLETVRCGIEIETDFGAGIPDVTVDGAKIEQVLINFLMNAIQAMAGSGEGGVLRVRTFWDRIGDIERDEGLREFERLRAFDHVVVVEIRDQGPGIAGDRLTRVFEPFYTTKPTGEGTGLGLSVAKNIMDLHRGHIQLRNMEDPRGLRVRLFLKARNVSRIEEPPEEMRLLTGPIKLNG